MMMVMVWFWTFKVFHQNTVRLADSLKLCSSIGIIKVFVWVYAQGNLISRIRGVHVKGATCVRTCLYAVLTDSKVAPCQGNVNKFSRAAMLESRYLFESQGGKRV